MSVLSFIPGAGPLLDKGLLLLNKPAVWVGILCVALFVSVQYTRIVSAHGDTLKAKLHDAETAALVAVQANQHQGGVIKDLNARLTACVDTNRINVEHQAQVLQAAIQSRDAAVAQATTAKRKRDELWKESKTCEGARAVDLAGVCPAIASGLRQRSGAHGS